MKSLITTINYEVYRVTNTSNNKIYIGYTSRGAQNRFNKHLGSARRGRSQIHFHAAIRKYPLEVWKLEVLHKTDSNELAKLLEIQEIKNHNSFKDNNGYNSTYGGDGISGVPMSEPHKAKLKATFTPERRRKLSEAPHLKNLCKENYKYLKDYRLRGISEEHRRKLSEMQIGEKNHMYGKKHTQEQKDLIASKLMGEKNHFYGKKHSIESRKKMSESCKLSKIDQRGSKNPAAVSIEINGVLYGSISEAMIATGLLRREINKLRNK